MSKTNISAKSTLIEAFNEYEKASFGQKTLDVPTVKM